MKFLKSLYRDFVSDAILMTTSFTWASMLFSSSSFSNILKFFCIKNGLFLSSIIDFLNDQTIAGASKATCNLHWCGQTLMWRWARSYRRFQEIFAHWLKIRQRDDNFALYRKRLWVFMKKFISNLLDLWSHVTWTQPFFLHIFEQGWC